MFILFNRYIQRAIDRVREKVKIGIKIQGESEDMIRFADDIAIRTESAQDLQEILNEMDRVLKEEFDIELNRQKTKILVCNKNQLNRTRITVGNDIQENDFTETIGSAWLKQY